MPTLGLPELAVVFIMVLILFGPGKLPKVFGALGDGVRQFKRASQGLTDDVNEGISASSAGLPESTQVSDQRVLEQGPLK
ncbi:MAG: twin-arginine translocase TatA/TatE family subunit [Vampirovibrionales bacterium]